MSDTTQMEVIVHKAIDLKAGETLGEFTNGLYSSGRDYVMKQLNIAKGKGSAYVLEVFSKNVVFCVYKYDETTSDSYSKYYAFTYERDANKNFKFGDMLEVERVSSFRPKKSMAVTKAATFADSALALVKKAKAKGKAAPPFPPQAATAKREDALPDIAFAHVTPARKDATGRTVPFSKRALPHHRATVKNGNELSSLDPVKLYKSLAALMNGDSGLPAADVEKARVHLVTHAKALLTARGGSPRALAKAKEDTLLKSLETLVTSVSVAKSADGAMWVPTASEFWQQRHSA